MLFIIIAVISINPAPDRLSRPFGLLILDSNHLQALQQNQTHIMQI